jgi:uncharacterized membrane protein
MWQFNWGVFWAVLVALFLIVGYVSHQLEGINKVLLSIESKLDRLRNRD